MTRNDRRTSARRFASPKFAREGNRAYTSFFTGKPHVTGLGHAFLMRNYRASLGKWQTADPLGYPDGWNAMAYCGNGVTGSVDLWGCKWVYKTILLVKKFGFGDLGLLIPGGLPIDLNPTPPPTIWSGIVSLFVGWVAQGISDDLTPNWESIKYFGNKEGYGLVEPSDKEIQDLVALYDDWEYDSHEFYTETHESEVMGEGEFVYKLTAAWRVILRKWEE